MRTRHYEFFPTLNAKHGTLKINHINTDQLARLKDRISFEKNLTSITFEYLTLEEKLLKELAEHLDNNDTLNTLSFNLRDGINAKMLHPFMHRTHFSQIQISILKMDAGAETLQFCQNIKRQKYLQQLSIRNTHFSLDTFRQLIDALCENKSIHHLNFAYNRLGNQAATEIARLIRLNLPHLHEINIANNNISNCNLIMDALIENNHLLDLKLNYNLVKIDNAKVNNCTAINRQHYINALLFAAIFAQAIRQVHDESQLHLGNLPFEILSKIYAASLAQAPKPISKKLRFELFNGLFEKCVGREENMPVQNEPAYVKIRRHA